MLMTLAKIYVVASESLRVITLRDHNFKHKVGFIHIKVLREIFRLVGNCYFFHSI